MKYRIGKLFSFDAAHKLPEHDGKCKNLHGHTYRLEVEVEGTIISGGPKSGMIMDLEDLSKIVKEYIDVRYDHHYLNETVLKCPTAELLATDFFLYVQDKLVAPVTVTRVRLWETSTSWAEVIV